MQVARHTPETCPDYNEKYRKATVDWMENAPKIAEKYGVKIVGIWNDHADHTTYLVYDVPNMESFMGFAMDPLTMPMYSFQNISVRPVFGPQEMIQMLKR